MYSVFVETFDFCFVFLNVIYLLKKNISKMGKRGAEEERRDLLDFLLDLIFIIISIIYE